MIFPQESHMTDNERQKYIQELLLKGECGKHHFARVVFIGQNGVGKTSLMRRLMWQKKRNVTSPESTDGIEIEKCNINVKTGKWSPCESKKSCFFCFVYFVQSILIQIYTNHIKIYFKLVSDDTVLYNLRKICMHIDTKRMSMTIQANIFIQKNIDCVFRENVCDFTFFFQIIRVTVVKTF